MTEGARVAQDLGADIIDINMGCPARQVTGGLSGSALMRDLDHALTLIEATVAARPGSRHAQDAAGLGCTLDQRARTGAPRRRCRRSDDYRTRTNPLPVLWRQGRLERHSRRQGSNQHSRSLPTATERRCRRCPRHAGASGADGVMIGRGAYGRPWWPGVIANQLDRGLGMEEPSLQQEAADHCRASPSTCWSSMAPSMATEWRASILAGPSTARRSADLIDAGEALRSGVSAS